MIHGTSTASCVHEPVSTVQPGRCAPSSIWAWIWAQAGTEGAQALAEETVGRRLGGESHDSHCLSHGKLEKRARNSVGSAMHIPIPTNPCYHVGIPTTIPPGTVVEIPRSQFRVWKSLRQYPGYTRVPVPGYPGYSECFRRRVSYATSYR
eukprot:1035596-Rhodomonas_salina.1